MRILNLLFMLVMLVIFGYFWIAKSNTLEALPYLGLALFSQLTELDYSIKNIFKK